MALRDFLRDDFRFVLFADAFSAKFTDPKEQRRAIQIVEGAIDCFARAGIYQTSMQMIAKQSGLSKTSLTRYFSTQKSVVESALKYTRMLYQAYVVEEMKAAKSPAQAFQIYFDSCFRWLEYFPKHVRFWLSFLHLCAAEKEFKALNTTSVEVGFHRLMSLVETGVKTGAFSCGDPEAVTRSIHHLISGCLLAALTEGKEVIENERQRVLLQCLKLLGAQGTSSPSVSNK